MTSSTSATMAVDSPMPTLDSIDTLKEHKDGPHSSRPGAEDGECRLLGPFALFVQAGLGCLALLSLVFKRWRERPRRPLKIWFFDVSKQVFGSVLLHIMNLLLSMLSSGDFEAANHAKQVAAQLEASTGKGPNPCSFYLINLAIDVSCPQIILPLHRMMPADTFHFIDNNRHPYSGGTPPPPPSRCRFDSPGTTARVHSQRPLRPAASRVMVAQTKRHLLLRPASDEALRLLHL